MNKWRCNQCQHLWSSESPAAYWCPSCGVPRVQSQPVFVAIEGIDASGKALQSKRLAEELKADLVSFPDYETRIGKLIAGHLRLDWGAIRAQDFVEYAGNEIDALVFQALQSANRLERAADIAAALAEGRPVVADRYIASGLVYGAADGVELGYLERLHRYLPQPTHQILLDIDPEISAERRPERRDRYEANAKFMQKVCLGYRQLWIRKGWPIVDGRDSVEGVAEQVLEVLRG